jgi:RNA polymerase sigma factor (sigma-70 family)
MNINLQKALSEEYGTTEKSKIFNQIYATHFEMVRKFILINNGTVNDAEDIFQDTLIILDRKLEEENFVLTAKLKTYIMGISKNLWYKKLRNKNFTVRLEEFHESDYYQDFTSSIERDKSNTEKLLNVISRISSHCNKLINDIFFLSKPIREIQKIYGYTSKHNAQNQKYKCIEQLKKEKIKVYG